MQVRFPKMIDVVGQSDPQPAFDFKEALSCQFTETRVLERIKPGQKVAIGVGSRGISNLREIVATVVQTLKSKGVLPYIVPAMGSHGGANSDGQAHALAEYGITPKGTGVPIDARMEARLLGRSENNVEVYCSEAALESDAIIVVNRIKPHTNFKGALGSGILKMLSIGLGKYKGAEACHSAAARLGYEPVIRSVGRFMLRETPFLCGIAVLEDQNHQTTDLRVLLPEVVEREEEKLFAKSQALMPQLPFPQIDLLIIDLLGKDLSGAGIDPNVIGRSVFGYSTAPEDNGNSIPRVQCIFVRDLSPATGGNALGIGLADFTTSRVVKKIDLQSTYANALTALLVATAKIPVYFDCDRETLQHAIASLAVSAEAIPRIVRIESTLSVSPFQASAAYYDEIVARSDLMITRSARELEFDSGGNLFPLKTHASV